MFNVSRAVICKFLKENPDKINWLFLSKNNNTKVISLLNENLNKINWFIYLKIQI